ncbi:LysM peptidoglycan-binding domain-containing protein [Adhaeribacter sp. BT258]|uniref:LysM peptidoglycan-binding domain-containing protein n=1 Tax=Adhaeribacter terrigena TaxID=2793070 RepID=A0ABS1C180_9BACT|nr:LysM peptidoglycan-binding domain-containing protein [Adhaeribacter terrigena]MBK0403127.1 LysM peptidoglycan-binding domain-containing protein [Adhaeribacter terrigena]
MGLFDFLKKGEQKPVEQPKTGAAKDSTGGFFNQGAAGQPAAGATAGMDTYTVKSGDSLSKIAKNFYGDAQQWKKIHEANKDQISNPDLIQPGWVLKIPKA